MPEWKSWTFGGEDEFGFAVPTPAGEKPAPAAPAPGMEVDPAAEKWGVEVEPVTIERIERVVEGDGLPHGSNEFVVITEIEGRRMQIHREPADSAWMQVETRIDLPAEAIEGLDAEALNTLSNGWNTDHLQPTMFAMRVEDGWAFVLATRFYVAEGMSDRQIHAALRRGVGVTRQAAEAIPGLVEAAKK